MSKNEFLIPTGDRRTIKFSKFVYSHFHSYFLSPLGIAELCFAALTAAIMLSPISYPHWGSPNYIYAPLPIALPLFLIPTGDRRTIYMLRYLSPYLYFLSPLGIAELYICSVTYRLTFISYPHWGSPNLNPRERLGF